MLTYWAITRQQGRWEYVCAGNHPEDVYRRAIDLITAQDRGGDDELYAMSSAVEHQLNNLRVVQEVAARDVYHATGGRVMVEE